MATDKNRGTLLIITYNESFETFNSIILGR